MKRIAGFGVFLAAYGLAWWSFEALTGRVAGTPGSNRWLPSLVDLYVPGRLAPNRLSGGSGPGSQEGGTAASPLAGTNSQIAAQGGQNPNAPIGSQTIPQNDTYLNPLLPT